MIGRRASDGKLVPVDALLDHLLGRASGPGLAPREARAPWDPQIRLHRAGPFGQRRLSSESAPRMASSVAKWPFLARIPTRNPCLWIRPQERSGRFGAPSINTTAPHLQTLLILARARAACKTSHSAHKFQRKSAQSAPCDVTELILVPRRLRLWVSDLPMGLQA